MNIVFKERLEAITREHKELLSLENTPILPGNGIFERYKYPVLTGAHTPLFWRYDLNMQTNPYRIRAKIQKCY